MECTYLAMIAPGTPDGLTPQSSHDGVKNATEHDVAERHEGALVAGLAGGAGRVLVIQNTYFGVHDIDAVLSVLPANRVSPLMDHQSAKENPWRRLGVESPLGDSDSRTILLLALNTTATIDLCLPITTAETLGRNDYYVDPPRRTTR